MWHDLYFKFANRQAYVAAWPEALKNAEDAALPMSSWNGNLYVVDEAGVFYTDAVYDAEGNLQTAPMALPGWHVNVRVKGEAPLVWPAAVTAAQIAEPEYPRRIFAE